MTGTKGNRAMKIFLIIILILAVIAAVVGYITAGYVMGIRRQTLEEARAWQESQYDLSWYDAADKSDYKITSYDGYELNVQFIPSDEPSDRYVIISHGYSDNRFGALKYGFIYKDMGFNLIVYDLRGHGLNEPTYCTYSVRESKDLLELIKDTRERYDNVKVLGLQGESLGAATSLAALESKPEIDFLVADCPFEDIEKVLKDGMKSMHIPGVLLDLANPFIKLRYGVSFRDMRPIDRITENLVPVLFMHGAADWFITPDNSEDMCRATAGYSDIMLIEGAEHAMSVIVDPKGYEAKVRDFLLNLNGRTSWK